MDETINSEHIWLEILDELHEEKNVEVDSIRKNKRGIPYPVSLQLNLIQHENEIFIVCHIKNLTSFYEKQAKTGQGFCSKRSPI